MHPLKIYGIATVNEKGQVVIPADARRDQGFEPGTRLVIMSPPHSHQGLMILKVEEVEKIMGHMAKGMGMVQEQIKRSEEKE
jgi:AbrB family looped-hinge helix DNA binding protein